MSVSLAVSAETIKIAGSTTASPVVDEIASAYRAENDNVHVEVSSVGSGVGLQQLVDSKIDIALSSRFASRQELHEAASKGVYLVPFRFAYDYIMPVVNPRNSVKNLTSSELEKIYSGEITNWNQVGGKDLPIRVVSREKTSGTYSLWNEKILGKEKMENADITVTSNAGMVAAVSDDVAAIGYIGQGYLNMNLKPVSIDGIYGTKIQAANSHYFLNRTLFMFTRGWPEGEVLNFINYVTHPEKGQNIVDKAGLVTLH
jgi:phosphate transport system substrate-binding protein